MSTRPPARSQGGPSKEGRGGLKSHRLFSLHAWVSNVVVRAHKKSNVVVEHINQHQHAETFPSFFSSKENTGGTYQSLHAEY